MKILYVQQHFATGRGEGGVRGHNLVKTLAARGHDVTVICGCNWRDSSLSVEKNQRVTESELDGCRIVQLNVRYSNHQGFLARIMSFLRFALAASYEVLRRDADLVYASSTPLTVSIPALCVRLLKGTPYVFEVRDLWPDLPIQMGIISNPLIKWPLYAWEWITYRFAWKLVALAPGIKSEIERKAGIPGERVAMIPNGGDTEHLRPLGRLPRTHIPVGEEKLVLAYAGTHGTANGLGAVLDAASVLKRRGVEGAALVLIGDGREKGALQKRAAAEGLDNVHFLGLHNKSVLNRLMAEIDVGMQILKNVPGFYYGTSPNKFFDYLAAGKPVLVNYPGWMSDLVSEHACGAAVPPDDPEAFADAVEQLLARRAELPEMGEAARRLAEEQFSQQKILVDLALFIEESRAELKTQVAATPRGGEAGTR